jgi:hypothetical protein
MFLTREHWFKSLTNKPNTSNFYCKLEQIQLLVVHNRIEVFVSNRLILIEEFYSQHKSFILRPTQSQATAISHSNIAFQYISFLIRIKCQ